MDKIKDAFKRVKSDIKSLREEIANLKLKLEQNEGEKYVEKRENSSTHPSTDNISNQTVSTHPSTDNYPFRALKPQNLEISTRNEGASTDRQTDRQTDTNTFFSPENRENSIKNAHEILESLDNIKKELRLKFKSITNQELLVFSAIYEMDEKKEFCNYKKLSKKLNLTESSIRDYVGRLIKKGIPVEKKRINNKNIQLSISTSLKKIATLSTILRLREL